MPWFEVHCFAKTFLGSPVIAGSLPNHPHQIIGKGSRTFEPKVSLAFRDRLIEPPQVGQFSRLV